jgi:hypothetical protein
MKALKKKKRLAALGLSLGFAVGPTVQLHDFFGASL